MRLRRRTRRVVARGRSASEDYYEETIPLLLGSIMSDWGPSEESRLPWRRKKEEDKPFGFSRALEE